MKTRNIRNVSLVLTVLVVALLIGCPPALEITPITAIAITGDEMVGETLGVESTPVAATGTYQWARADAADGAYTPIAGATGATYDLVAADAGKYLKVTITGTNLFSGTVTSVATGPIANAGQLAPIGLAGVAPTSFGGSDGKITGTTDAMEYKLSTDTDYVVAGEGETTGLAAGEYDVRYAAFLGYNAGAAVSVDVPAFEPIQLTIEAPTLTKSKVYDGTTTADVAAGALVGVVNGDDVTVSAEATYDTKDVGTGKTITVVYTLGGADAANYIKPVDDTDDTGEITAILLTVNAPTLTTTKEYDGDTTAVVTAGTLGGIVGLEDVTVTAVATYDTKDVGTNKTITVVYTLGGAHAANYIKPVDGTDETGEITALPITAIGAISGTAMVGEELTAGTLTPSGATADYQWTICDTEGGSYANIGGATASTYTLVVADEGKFIKVVATGTGNYSGTATSAATVAVAEKVYVAGDTGPAGGLVFYDKGSVSDGWRYLEAAPTDIAVSGTYIYGYSRTDSTSSATTVLIGATATAIGTGQANTTALVNAMGSNAYEVLFAFQSTSTTANYAARLCDIHVVGTFEDWFLPSIDELNSMYTNLKSNGLGDFTTTGFYWSSSEFAAGSASVKLFNVNGTQQNNDKSSLGHVRPIRSF